MGGSFPRGLVTGDAVFFEIFLVVIFGPVKDPGRNKFGRQGRLEPFRGPELGHDLFRRFLLFLAVIEDHRPVLAAPVRPLAVDLGGVVDGEEPVEKLFIADHGGIEGQLDGLGVPRPAGAYVFIGRLGRFSPREPDSGRKNAGDLPVVFLLYRY